MPWSRFVVVNVVVLMNVTVIACFVLHQVKTELQEKNSKLSDALTKAREDLKSAERDRTLLEDEKRRVQTQLTTVQHQAASNESALQTANQVNNSSTPTVLARSLLYNSAPGCI